MRVMKIAGLIVLGGFLVLTTVPSLAQVANAPGTSGYVPGGGWSGYTPGGEWWRYAPGNVWPGYAPGTPWSGYTPGAVVPTQPPPATIPQPPAMIPNRPPERRYGYTTPAPRRVPARRPAWRGYNPPNRPGELFSFHAGEAGIYADRVIAIPPSSYRELGTGRNVPLAKPWLPNSP